MKKTLRDRRVLAGLLLLGVTGVLSRCSLHDSRMPPHVVLIIIDTLRADHLGCYGDKRRSSPELDDYASKGVRFAHVISQTSWTRPSVGSMLTSLYPRSLGIHHEAEGILNDRFVTLAEVLHQKVQSAFLCELRRAS